MIAVLGHRHMLDVLGNFEFFHFVLLHFADLGRLVGLGENRLCRADGSLHRRGL